MYLGAIEAAFSALMRLSLRLVAERSDRPDALGDYLDDPLLLFVPVRLLLGLVTGDRHGAARRAASASTARTRSPSSCCRVAAFVVVCELLLPLRDRRPRSGAGARSRCCRRSRRSRARSAPITRWIARTRRQREARRAAASTPDEAAEEANEAAKAYIDTAEQEGLIEGEERRLLQSIVDFGDTLVREVMTPRPDIVAIRDDATIGDLRALFREQEYSRFPVYKENLDNIAGFVFVKDLVAARDRATTRGRSRRCCGRRSVVPETKRVPELLKQFQRQQTQCAIVVDEYGGTAGLVTIEDLLEEIVGEIRDEYDVESEPIVDEGQRPLRVQRQGGHRRGRAAARASQIEREGFETVGGYRAVASRPRAGRRRAASRSTA